MNDSLIERLPSLDGLSNQSQPSWSPTQSPTVFKGSYGNVDEEGEGMPEGGGKITFEYGLMLWYSAFMFIVSGSLFAAYAIERWRGRSPVWLVKGLDVASYSSLYFAFSVTLVVYNKWLIAVWEGGFAFPLTMTLVHMALKMIMSWTVVKGCRASSEAPKVSRWTYYLYACPVGATTALDIASSNASLYYVSVTLYTVIKSTSLVFVLIYSVLYRLQSCSTKLVLVTGVIFAGVIMASYGDSQFDPIGFGLVFVASAIGGYRWALTEVLMNRIGTKMNSLMTIYTISPASVVVLIPFVIWLEWDALINSKFYSDPGLFVLAILNTCGSGVFAFAMIYVELAVLNRTSSLTLVVIGYFKQMAQIIVSVIVFHEVLSPMNVFGVVITFLGMGLYAGVKHSDSSHGARPEGHKKHRKRVSVNAREVDDSQIPLSRSEADTEGLELPPTTVSRRNTIHDQEHLDASFDDVMIDQSEAGLLRSSEHEAQLTATTSTPLTGADPIEGQERKPKHQTYEMVIMEESS